MTLHARGLLCLPVRGARLDDLEIPLMVRRNNSTHSTAFTVSVDAARDITTGISAADRAQTIRTIVSPSAKADDLVQPGHIFPLRAREGGVLEREGHTEAIVDLARLAGLYPAGVLCEILNRDGTMARLPQLEVMAAQYGIRIVSIASIIQFRQRLERVILTARTPVLVPAH
jgi:3,4-dihydroxy 2-butanone 4-phosphate synthase/GTP cyclohydrolase II